MRGQAKRTLIGIVIGVWIAAYLWAVGRPLEAAPVPQAPVLRPEDISTPTPTPVPLPTPTPDPEVSAPGVAAEPRRVTGQTYVVQPEDTLWTVALEVGVDLEEAPCLVAPTFQPDQPLVI